jgi:hypothetical protein
MLSFRPDLLKVIQLKPRFLFGIWFLGSLVLLLPIRIIEVLGLGDIRGALSPWLGLVTLSAFSFWLVQLIPEYQKLRARRRMREEMTRSLEFISPEEWILLAYCLKNNQQTITLSIVDRVAGSLAARGILVRAAGVWNQLAWPFTLHKIIWEHLLLNREEFMAKAPFPHADIESGFQNLDQHICRYDY